MWQQEEGGPGERSPFCAKSLSAIWGPCVQHDCLPAWGRDPSACLSLSAHALELSGFGGQSLRTFLGSPDGGILWDWGSMGSL